MERVVLLPARLHRALLGRADVPLLLPRIRLQPWPGDGLYLHFAALAALAVLVGVGCFYRAAIILLCFGWTYLFLLDQANHRNHFYLLCLMSFLMIFVPAHRALSVDAWRRPAIRGEPVRTYLAARTDVPLIGAWLGQEWTSTPRTPRSSRAIAPSC